MTGHPRDAAEGKWALGDEIKVPCLTDFIVPKRAKPNLELKDVLWDHSFSTYAKFSEKLTFLCP